MIFDLDARMCDKGIKAHAEKLPHKWYVWFCPTQKPKPSQNQQSYFVP